MPEINWLPLFMWIFGLILGLAVGYALRRQKTHQEETAPPVCKTCKHFFHDIPCKELVDFGLCGCDKPVKTVSHEEEIVK